MSVRFGDFGRAIEHQRRQVIRFEAAAAENPRLRWQMKSCWIALAALELIKEYGAEGMVLATVAAEHDLPKPDSVPEPAMAE